MMAGRGMDVNSEPKPARPRIRNDRREAAPPTPRRTSIAATLAGRE